MKRYVYLLIVLFIAAINFNIFLKPFGLVTGGTQGLGLIISKISNIEVWIIILTINILMLITSYLFLSHRTTIGTIISTFIYPLFIKYTNFINIEFKFYYIIICAILCGITSGIIYKLGFSSGGINIIPLILNKYLKIKIYISVFIINFLIIFLSIKTYGLYKSICSFIIILISSLTISVFLKKN